LAGKEVRADILAVLLKSSVLLRAGRVGGATLPVIMNLKNQFEYFQTHTANQKTGANLAKFASQYCLQIGNFYLLNFGQMRAFEI